MKFGEKFNKHMVPEWTDGYVDYYGLKGILRDIRSSNEIKQPPNPSVIRLYRVFSGLVLPSISQQDQTDAEAQVVMPPAAMQCESVSRGLRSADEIRLFKKLDEELDKVNEFYKGKVEEVMREASLLSKQMEALVALRVKVRRPDPDSILLLRRLSSDVSTTAPSRITSLGRRGTADFSCTSQVDNNAVRPGNGTLSTVKCNDTSKQEINGDKCKSAGLEVLNHVKINNTLESPIATIKGILHGSTISDLRFNKEEMRNVEDRLKTVFVEFYQKLQVLKNYSYINISAFANIVAKYEKITSRRVLSTYMKKVDNSYLGSSDEINGLLARVETTFIKYFSKANHREGMKLLRPKQKKERQSVTFVSGFLSGCSISLTVAVALLLVTRKITIKEEGTVYIGNIFPLYRLYVYIVLHMILFATNIYFWRRYQINYPFIFGLKKGTELGYMEVFLLGVGLLVLALATFLAQLHVKVDIRTHGYEKYINLIPLVMLIVVLVLAFCPFNIMYRSSRCFFIRSIFRCICAPLYKIQAMRSFEYYICYYGWGQFASRQNKCHSFEAYNAFYFIVTVIPYWLRFLQCIRQFIEAKDVTQVWNSLRYLFTIVAVVIRTVSELRKGMVWKVLAFLSSAVASIFNTYWDVVLDWGLLHMHSRNLFLRDRLSVPHRSVYFAAVVSNILLRFAWLQSVLVINVHSLSGNTISSIYSCLEILRRGIWNFFRVENEHLNNVGKYRAFKSVPLPFKYCEEDSDKDD